MKIRYPVSGGIVVLRCSHMVRRHLEEENA
jgi:hypothetical protein